MKTLIYILLSLPLLGGFGYVAFRDCGNLKYQTAVTIMTDITEDNFLALPESSSVTNFFGVSKNVWDGFHFRLRTISDIEITPVLEADLEPKCQYISNIYERKKLANEFLEKMKNAIEESNGMVSGKKRSYIYVSMIAELNHLVKIQAENRVLLVYSDLNEYSSVVNFYSKKHFSLLQQHPENVVELFKAETLIPDLTGITIYFIYQPHNSEEGERFSLISKFFKQLFESRGAKIQITANLIN